MTGDRAGHGALVRGVPHDGCAPVGTSVVCGRIGDVDEEYTEAVLDLVAAIPVGRAMTYGTVAEVVSERFVAAGGRPRGGPRQVGQVMARTGAAVPWWRVVDASGAPPARHAERALRALADEGTPLTADGRRVALRRAVWFPTD